MLAHPQRAMIPRTMQGNGMRRVEGSRFRPKPRPYRIVLWGEVDQSKLPGILERIQHHNLKFVDETRRPCR